MIRALLFAGILFACAKLAAAADRDTEFLDRARVATEKYQDQPNAILDGYRPIGRDFPGMGEHWVRIGILFDSRIEAEHPEFLTYISVSGKPKLVGLAYALPLLPGEPVPDLPAGKNAWHDHFRSIDDETMVPHHHHTGTADDEPRITMLHVWIWAPNPDGIFAADNWAIPYMRLGMTPPDQAPRAAALALSLASGGADYFSMSIDAAGPPTKKQRTKIDAAFDRARSAVDRSIREKDLDKLSAIWMELWKAIDASISAQAREQLRKVLPNW